MGWREICKPRISKCYENDVSQKVETEVCITYGFILLKGHTAVSGDHGQGPMGCGSAEEMCQDAKGNSNTISALRVLYQADSSQLTLWLNLPCESLRDAASS